MPAGFDAEVAELFRDLRLASNLDEAQLANRLSTQVEVVQALEQGTLYALPPWPETSRVVSAYGELLNLDVQPLLRRVYAQVEAGVIPEEMPPETPPPLDFSIGETYGGPSTQPEETPPGRPSNGGYADSSAPYGEPGYAGTAGSDMPPRQPDFAPAPGPQGGRPPQGAPQGGPYPQGPQGMPDPRAVPRPMPGGPGARPPGQPPQGAPRPPGQPPQYRPPPPGAPQGQPAPGQEFRPPPPQPAPGGPQGWPQPGQAAPPPQAAWPEQDFGAPSEAEIPVQEGKKGTRLKKAIAMIVVVLAAIFVLWLLFSQVGSLFGTGGAPQQETGQSTGSAGGDAAPDEPLDPDDPQSRKSDRLPLPDMPQ